MAKFRHFVASVGLLAGLGAPLGAQDNSAPPAPPPPVPMERAVPTWSHDRSGLTLPGTLAGFQRTGSKQFDQDGYNIGINFRDNASGSWADLFIYRAAPASVAVWGDRAAAGMFANPMLGEVDLATIKVARFTPPNGAGDNSGLRIVTPVKNDLSASGLAIYLHDGWLVKLRMSSRTMDVAAMEARMSEFVAALTLPAATQPAPPFAEIANCAAPMKPGKKAKMIELDMTSTIIFGGLLGVELGKQDDEAPAQAAAPEVPFCRDPASVPQYGIYRRGDAVEGYLIAFGDTGTSLTVAPYDLGPLMKPSRGFTVRQSDGVTEQVYPPFAALPSPEQAMGLPGKVGVVFSAGLMPGGKGPTINVQAE